jgi:hypothetical protein
MKITFDTNNLNDLIYVQKIVNTILEDDELDNADLREEDCPDCCDSNGYCESDDKLEYCMDNAHNGCCDCNQCREQEEEDEK